MPGDGACRRLDAGGVHSLHLAGVLEDVAELFRQTVNFCRAQLEFRERSDGDDLLVGDPCRHGKILQWTYYLRGSSCLRDKPWTPEMPKSTAVRPEAVAGSWYPADARALSEEVDGYLAAVSRELDGDLVALIAPHAGLMY